MSSSQRFHFRFMRHVHSAALAALLGLAPLAHATSTINLAFSPATINPGDATVLTVQITNSALATLDAAAATVVLPAGISLNSATGSVNTCGFSESAAVGATTLVLTGGTIPAAANASSSGICDYTIAVRDTTAGNLSTTIPVGPAAGFTRGGNVAGYESDELGVPITNSTPTTATLSVTSLNQPTGVMSFLISPLRVGDSGGMRVVLGNSNASANIPLTTFTQNLPTGLVISATPGATVSCTGTNASNGTLSSPSGSGGVAAGDTSYTLTGGAIGAGGSCTINVNVTPIGSTGTAMASAAPGAIGNTRGLSSAIFSANLTVSTPLAISQGIPASTIVGEVATITITATNSSTTNAISLQSLTDLLATGLTIDTSVTPGVVCAGGGSIGTLTAVNGASSINLSGATIAANRTCVITVGVSADAAGNYASAITTASPASQASTTSLPNAALAIPTSSPNVTFASPMSITQVVGGSNIVGEVATLTITVNNSSALNTLDIASLTDNLQSGLLLDASVTPSLACTGTGAVNGTLTATAGTGMISIANAKAGRSGKCTIVVGVTASAIGSYSSTLDTSAPNTSIATGSTPPIALTPAASSTNVSFVTPLSITKGSTPASGTAIRLTGVATLTITVANASTANAMNITSLSDVLQSGLVLSSAVTPSVVCTGTGASNGVLTATDGASSLNLANAVAGKAGNCLITVGVTASTAGTYSSTLALNAPATQISTATASPIALTPSATTRNFLYQGGISMTKTGPNTAYQGQPISYTVVVSNYTAGAISNVSLSDSLPTSNPNPQMTLDAGSSLGAGCSGGTLSANAGGTQFLWTGGTVAAPAVATSPTPSTCTITIKAIWPDTAAVGARYRNTLQVGAFSGTDVSSATVSNASAVPANNNGTTTASLTVGQALLPASIVQGNTSQLTITITNPTAAPLTATTMSQTLPANVTVAPVPATTSSCVGTVVNATPRASSYSFDSMTVPAGGSCTVRVTLTSAVVGSYSLSVPAGAVSNNEGISNSQAAGNVSLTVTSGMGAAVVFNPTSTGLGGIARLSITATNNSAIALTALSINSNFPVNTNAFVMAPTPNASTTCAGSPLITAGAGATSVAMSGATLATGANCTLSFDIKTTGSSASGWAYTLAANSIQSAEGVNNTNAPSATLTKVAAVAIGINKSFSPISILGGAPSTLRIDLSNPNTAASAANNVSLTDVFPTGMEVFSVPNAHTNCVNGVISATPGAAQFSFSGADIAIGASCSLFLDVTSVKSLNLTNTIAAGTVSTLQGFTNAVQTQATLSTLQGVNVEKSFNPVAITPGQTSRLTVRLISTLNTTTLTNVGLTDTLPTSPGAMKIAATPNLASTCNTQPTATPATGVSMSIAGVTLIPQDNCSFSVDVTANTVGSYTNAIPVGGATSSEGFSSQTAAQATLNVLNAPTVGMAFSTNPVKAGSPSLLTITLTNTNASALTGVALSNVLPAGLAVANPTNASTTCTGAVYSPVAGATSLSLTGASIAGNGSCTLQLNLASNTPGSFTPSVSAGGLVTAQGISNAVAANATLNVLQFPTVAAAFASPTLAPAATTQFTVTLGNSNASAITLSSVLTVSLPSAPGTMTIASPNGLSKSCPGSVTATAGATSFTYANGATIPVGGCTITVNVTASVDGTYTQTVPAGSLQTSAGNQQSAASASIAVSNNTPPTAANLSLTLNNDASAPVSVGTLNGTPQSPATIASYTITSVPASKAVVYCVGTPISGANLPYPCAANQVAVLPVAAPGGSTSFTYVAVDSNGLASVDATITVNFNVPPVATPVTATAILATAATAQPLANMAGTATGAIVSSYTVTVVSQRSHIRTS